MGVIFHNANPVNNLVGDCVIRSIAVLTNQSWDDTYLGIVMQGFVMKDMPSSNAVWGEYLKNNGFKRFIIPDTCPSCYTVRDFCNDNPYGSYLLATGSHVIAVLDGDYIDTWDSGNEIPIYYWKKE